RRRGGDGTVQAAISAATVRAGRCLMVDPRIDVTRKKSVSLAARVDAVNDPTRRSLTDRLVSASVDFQQHLLSGVGVGASVDSEAQVLLDPDHIPFQIDTRRSGRPPEAV